MKNSSSFDATTARRIACSLIASATAIAMPVVAFAQDAATAVATTPDAGTPNPLLPHNLSPWGMFMNADIVVKVVMIGLAFASLITWTVCFAKMVELRADTRKAKKRIKVLSHDNSMAEADRDTTDKTDAVAQLVQSAVKEASLSEAFDDGFKERVELRLSRVEAAMQRKISRGTGVLATIGATAPFVGLFGTVWGIMNSFIGSRESHTTNLAVVAPGIAEALLATALGLIAAIPAVVIYNHLARVISGYRALLGDASAQLLLIVSRGQRRNAASRQHAAE